MSLLRYLVHTGGQGWLVPVHLRLPDFSAIRVLVAGDVMLDRYWSGKAERISPEAPVPVVEVEDEVLRLGGAGNVAANLASLGARASLLAPIGSDQHGRTLARLLRQHGIDNRLVVQSNVTTPLKLRVVSQHQQLIRLDFEKPSKSSNALFRKAFRSALNHCEAVILSDYGKGALEDPQPLIRLCRRMGKPVFVDPKRSDFSAYDGATAITPNRRELEAVVGPIAGLEEIPAHAGKLCRKHHVKAMLVTLGEQGMLLQEGRRSHHLAATAREVFDVTGAGDTVVAMFACAHAAGLTLEEAMRLANLAAGQVVGKFGTASVTPDELKQAIRFGRKMKTGIVSHAALRQSVREIRDLGETVVLTNGCFDILHAGHVALLEQAAELGDWLIVAVNSDSSVRRNKGPGRPVQPLKYRQQVLAGLECVDWVVSFSQKTPEQLIRGIKPDVLVKGADYKASEVVGRREVEQGGGKVVILPLVEDYSTTNLLRRIRESEK